MPTTRDLVPFGNVVVLNGRVAGWWKRTLRTRSVVVDARWFVEPSGAQRRAFAAAFERYAAFLSAALAAGRDPWCSPVLARILGWVKQWKRRLRAARILASRASRCCMQP